MLSKLLVRFSDMFISPLFNRECLESEISAIDYEFEAARQTNKNRIDQLRGHTAPADHPFNRFTWGNRESLSEVKKKKLIKLLRKLFDESFVGSSMNLVILGKKPLDVLKNWVISYFGPIKKQVPGPESSSSHIATSTPIWKEHTLFFSKSVEDNHLLEVSWTIPSPQYGKIPEQFLVIALGHKGEGSLYSMLREKLWLVTLHVSSGDYKVDDEDDDKESEGTYACTSVGRLFSLSLELTNLGSFKVFDIVGHVYEYLQFVRQNDAPWIMEEFFKIKNMEFCFFDTSDLGSDASALTKKIAVNMLYVPLKDAVCSDFLNQSCNRDSIDELLKCFDPRNMRLDFVSMSDEGQDLLEPRFHTFYKEVQIPSDVIEKWLNPITEDYFQFPPRNRFLPTIPSYDDDEGADDDEGDEEADDDDEFMDGADHDEEADDEGDEEADDDEEAAADDVMDDADEEVESCLLVDERSIKLWHTLEDSVPTFVFSVGFKIEDDLKSQILAQIFLQLLKDSLESILSEGKRANLSTTIKFLDTNKIEIKTSGFKDSFHLYISSIWNVLKSCSPSAHSFETDKEILTFVLKNNIIELLDHSKALFQGMVSRSFHSVERMLDALKLLSFEDVKQFVSDLRSQMFIQGVFSGNMSKEEALTISELFKSQEITPLQEDFRDDLREDVPRPCEPSNHYIDDFVKIKTDINSLATVCFQFGTKRGNARDTALLHLFYSLIEENIVYWLKMFPDFNKRVRRNLKEIEKEDVLKFYKKYLIETSPETRTLSIRIWGCNSRFA
ncbi:unnamed protein product [Eruca vesicaria subsp. sativa]|uniref:Uncharacterized protein n=1 Tax=Eruca vesicaria subsp. sativa TaxID=29727 RepID=A0ABC8LWV0_ERUVS|nr:unnamed protein product [Eruca vesicaria subsp. sativa]